MQNFLLKQKIYTLFNALDVRIRLSEILAAQPYVPKDEQLGFSRTRRAITRIAMEGRNMACHSAL